MNRPPSTTSIEPPTPSKQSQSDEIARQTEAYLKKQGRTEPEQVPTPTAEEVIAKVKLKYTQNGKPLE